MSFLIAGGVLLLALVVGIFLDGIGDGQQEKLREVSIGGW
jgi:hypothetical protein